MTSDSLQVTGQVQTHSHLPLLPPAAGCLGTRPLAPGWRHPAAVGGGNDSAPGEALGEAAEEACWPSAAESLPLRTGMDESRPGHFP